MLQDIQRDEHYIPNWNFMPRNETVKLQDYYVQSSSYKIFNVKNIIFQIGILCRRKKNDDKLFFWLELFDV